MVKVDKKRQNRNSVTSVLSVRPAKISDHKPIARFLNSDTLTHHHLDWHAPLDLLDQPALVIQEKNGKIEALLSCAPENADAAWVRLFVCARDIPYSAAWQNLLPPVLDILRSSGVKRLASLALQDWFETLLSQAGFTSEKSVIVLEWNGGMPPKTSQNSDIIIRLMAERDLEVVQGVDSAAFPALWQNALSGLKKALHLSAHSTVALINNQIIGYQISTATGISAHLSRLAVLPDFQKQHVAYSLVSELLQHFDEQGVWRITVNTQSDNLASINLYDKLGFAMTGEAIKVYQRDLHF